MQMNNLSPELSNNIIISRNNFLFDPHSRKWQISRDNCISLTWIDDFLHPDLHSSYLKVLRYYAEIYSAGHTNNLSDRFREFARFTYEKRGLVDKITSDDLINYRSTLAKEHEWYLGTIRVFLKSWLEFGYSGVDPNIAQLLDGWRLRGNIKGRAVQTLCPKEGPLSDLEFEALHHALIQAFESNSVSLDSFVLVSLFIATGRRPAQLGDLKIKDLIEAQSKEGLQEFILNIPRRKQHGSSWREEFKPFALVREVGIALKALIEQNRIKFSSFFANISLSSVAEIPIFPNWYAIDKMKNDLSVESIDELLSAQEFHIATDDLRIMLHKTISSLSIPSERTGENLHVFPTRLRRTLATRAAREGYGELIIAELLDHTDTQNARVYTENVPEHVDAINEAMARQLAPLAQAFAGMLVEHEKNAIRGNDISSRVKSEHGGIGTCGHHGFCGALAPIACYTCRQFQPWLNAPHQNVLDSLLAERQRIFEITQDAIMAAINDRTILAVTEVIQQCEARYNQLRKEISLHD